LPLAAYIRERLFDDPSPRKRNFRQPLKDEKSLAKLLSDLGRSHIANNLNQLAKASNSGSLPLTEETNAAIHAAYKEVQQMRQYIIKALGLKP